MFSTFRSRPIDYSEPSKATTSLPQQTESTKPLPQSISSPNQRSTLEYRPRDSTPLFASSLSHLPPPSKKREYVDLTVNDDDEEPYIISRKKSRSSSQSTEISIENKVKQPLELSRPDLKSIKSDERAESLSFPRVVPSPRALSSEQPASSKPTPREPASKKPSIGEPSFKEQSSRTYAAAVVVPPPQPSPEECRRQFLENLSILGRGVSLWNGIDTASPPISFQFVPQSILGTGVFRTTEDFMSGCKCRKDNGRQIGCEYLSCECLDDSAVNTEGKRVFPYSASKLDFGCLRQFYLESRHHIYECNRLCNCESNCKNRVVQHGRTVPLQIFKTTNRGWGLRCMQDLKKGQFIDTYRGEIITNDEANKRGGKRTVDEEIYLMDLDKWTEEEGAAQYVCDGMHVGGPTRFINHSCDPNCAIYTVSYNHADNSIYELAFFATEAIPKGTELTFDYVSEEDHTPITEKRANELEKEKGYRPAKCLCGAATCRGYFFN